MSASDPQFANGGTQYTARVIGFDIMEAGLTGVPAFPNFDDTDGDLTRDFIDDSNQGYALVVSGKVGSPRGLVYFDRAFYNCDDRGAGEDVGKVFVHDCDGLQGTSLTLRSSTGAGEDCAVVTLNAPEPNGFVFDSTSFSLADVSEGLAADCLAPDNVLITEDDSVITVEYVDASPVLRTVQATARVSCRDVSLESVAVSVLNGDCTPGNALTLGPGVEGILEVTLRNEQPWPVTNPIATLHSAYEDVVVGAALVPGMTGGLPESVTAYFPVYIPDGDWTGVTSLRFRLELTANDGFEDRVWFDVPFDEMAPPTASPVLRPGEVPTGEGGSVPVSARIDGNQDPAGQDIRFEWGDAANATLYNIWKGDLSQLPGGVYSHGLRQPAADEGFCNVSPEVGPVNNETIELAAVPGTGSFYYLLTAENSCTHPAVIFLTLDGPTGVARADLDGDGVLEASDDRPAGELHDTGCLP